MFYIIKYGLNNLIYIYTGYGWTRHVLDGYPYFSYEEALYDLEKLDIKSSKILRDRDIHSMIDEGGSL